MKAIAKDVGLVFEGGRLFVVLAPSGSGLLIPVRSASMIFAIHRFHFWFTCKTGLGGFAIC